MTSLAVSIDSCLLLDYSWTRHLHNRHPGMHLPHVFSPHMDARHGMLVILLHCLLMKLLSFVEHLARPHSFWTQNATITAQRPSELGLRPKGYALFNL